MSALWSRRRVAATSNARRLRVSSHGLSWPGTFLFEIADASPHSKFSGIRSRQHFYSAKPFLGAPSISSAALSTSAAASAELLL
ncbi:MAG: hypothetical protein ABJC13_20905 [Acidobacteriota bacterium]